MSAGKKGPADMGSLTESAKLRELEWKALERLEKVFKESGGGAMPHGWRVEARQRQTGVSKGDIDYSYFGPSGRRFRSQKEAVAVMLGASTGSPSRPKRERMPGGGSQPGGSTKDTSARGTKDGSHKKRKTPGGSSGKQGHRKRGGGDSEWTPMDSDDSRSYSSNGEDGFDGKGYDTGGYGTEGLQGPGYASYGLEGVTADEGMSGLSGEEPAGGEMGLAYGYGNGGAGPGGGFSRPSTKRQRGASTGPMAGCPGQGYHAAGTARHDDLDDNDILLMLHECEQQQAHGHRHGPRATGTAPLAASAAVTLAAAGHLAAGAGAGAREGAGEVGPAASSGAGASGASTGGALDLLADMAALNQLGSQPQGPLQAAQLEPEAGAAAAEEEEAAAVLVKAESSEDVDMQGVAVRGACQQGVHAAGPASGQVSLAHEPPAAQNSSEVTADAAATTALALGDATGAGVMGGVEQGQQLCGHALAGLAEAMQEDEGVQGVVQLASTCGPCSGIEEHQVPGTDAFVKEEGGSSGDEAAGKPDAQAGQKLGSTEPSAGDAAAALAPALPAGAATATAVAGPSGAGAAAVALQAGAATLGISEEEAGAAEALAKALSMAKRVQQEPGAMAAKLLACAEPNLLKVLAVVKGLKELHGIGGGAFDEFSLTVRRIRGALRLLQR